MISVAAIMPVYNTPVGWQREAVAALESQKGLGVDFSLKLFRVFREDEPGLYKRCDVHIPFEDVSFNRIVDRPTAIEQCEVGFTRSESFDYRFALSSNDIYDLSYIEDCLNVGQPVVYGDVGFYSGNMKKERVDKSFFPFDPPRQILETTKLVNVVPDSALVREDIYSLVPFTSSFRRASFHIWWMKIWEEFGSQAFGYIGKPGFWMRRHSYEKSIPRRDEYRFDGYMRISDWVNSRPWFKEHVSKMGRVSV